MHYLNPWSYKENNCSCHYLVLLQTNLQCIGGETDLILLNFSLQKAQATTMCSYIYIWQECNGFSKGIFHPHLRPFIGGEAQVLEWIKGNPNNYVASWRFHYWDQTALGQRGRSVFIFTAPVLIWLKSLTTSAAGSSPMSWHRIPQMVLSAKNATPAFLHISPAFSRKKLYHLS